MCHVAALTLTAKAVANNLSCVHDDDKSDDIVIVSEVDSSLQAVTTMTPSDG